jgi:hypothetical protein
VLQAGRARQGSEGARGRLHTLSHSMPLQHGPSQCSHVVFSLCHEQSHTCTVGCAERLDCSAPFGAGLVRTWSCAIALSERGRGQGCIIPRKLASTYIAYYTYYIILCIILVVYYRAGLPVPAGGARAAHTHTHLQLLPGIKKTPR